MSRICSTSARSIRRISGRKWSSTAVAERRCNCSSSQPSHLVYWKLRVERRQFRDESSDRRISRANLAALARTVAAVPLLSPWLAAVSAKIASTSRRTSAVRLCLGLQAAPAVLDQQRANLVALLVLQVFERQNSTWNRSRAQATSFRGRTASGRWRRGS